MAVYFWELDTAQPKAQRVILMLVAGLYPRPSLFRLVKRKPPAVSRRGFSWRSVVSGSEVALNANVESDGVVVLELVAARCDRTGAILLGRLSLDRRAHRRVIGKDLGAK